MWIIFYGATQINCDPLKSRQFENTNHCLDSHLYWHLSAFVEDAWILNNIRHYKVESRRIRRKWKIRRNKNTWLFQVIFPPHFAFDCLGKGQSSVLEDAHKWYFAFSQDIFVSYWIIIITHIWDLETLNSYEIYCILSCLNSKANRFPSLNFVSCMNSIVCPLFLFLTTWRQLCEW